MLARMSLSACALSTPELLHAARALFRRGEDEESQRRRQQQACVTQGLVSCGLLQGWICALLPSSEVLCACMTNNEGYLRTPLPFAA